MEKKLRTTVLIILIGSLFAPLFPSETYAPMGIFILLSAVFVLVEFISDAGSWGMLSFGIFFWIPFILIYLSWVLINRKSKKKYTIYWLLLITYLGFLIFLVVFLKESQYLFHGSLVLAALIFEIFLILKSSNNTRS